ncbi:MAG: WD40 repeat domain-containing serine/threonine-protein kinase [Fuerstiella sp.]
MPEQLNRPTDVPDQTLSVHCGPEIPAVRSAGSDETAVPQCVGRFRIRRVLGTGGFGTVYQAYDPLLDREVALKVPRLIDNDPTTYDRFLHEAKAAARLRHPNIVAVFECGTVDRQPFIASEFVDGTPLSEVLKTQLPDRTVAVQLVRQIAEAIHYAHSEGIVHRDLKPANIMMSRSGRPQVMDFGLARLTTDSEMSLMAEGYIVGTPSYMSPEQARGDREAVGPRSDLYSVGVLLYVMLCGRRPFSGEAWSVISRVADPLIPAESPRRISPDVPPDLEACCLKAIDKDPNRRYGSLQEFADDLTRWLEGRPLAARPISWSERLLRWCDKNRLTASLLSAITLLILTASIVGYVLAFQFRNLAEYATDRAQAAETATRKEEEARRQAEQLLIDTFSESGLIADRNGFPQDAVLWFSNAVHKASEHPLRDRLNRIRMQTWFGKTPIPVRMFRGLERLHKSLKVHPGGQYLLSEQHGPAGDDCQIWNVGTADEWRLPVTAPVSAATWSPDGTRLALATEDSVRIVDFPDGRLLTQWQHPDPVLLLQFSGDGGRLAVGGENSVAIHQVDGESRSTLLVESVNKTCGLVFSPSGAALALLDNDRRVSVWGGSLQGPPERLPLPVLKCPFESLPPTLQFTSDSLLVVPEAGIAVRCWDVNTAEEVWTVPCSSKVNIAATHDLSRVAILNDSRLQQVDAATGARLGPPIIHPNTVMSAAYDPSGRRLLTGCIDQVARIYHVDQGGQISSIRHSDIVHHVAWFPDGRACTTAQWKADLVRVWKLGVAEVSASVGPPQPSAMHVKWNEDGSALLASGFDARREAGPCMVLKPSDLSPVCAPIEFPGRISDACFLPGRQQLVIAGAATVGADGPDADLIHHQDLSSEGLVRRVDLNTGQPATDLIRTSTNPIAVTGGGEPDLVIVLCHDGQLLLIDANTGKIRYVHHAFPNQQQFYGFAIRRRLQMAPQRDRFVVWGSASRSAEVRSAVDGSLLFTVSHPNESNLYWLHDVKFSPDGTLLATCSADHTVQLWDAYTGEKLPVTLQHAGWVFNACFSSDGTKLLTACRDKQVRLWDLSHPDKPILATPAQPDEVYAACFLPGEENFVIGLRNGEVSAWEVRQGRQIAPAAREPDQQVIYSLALSPDQSRIVMVSRDGQVRAVAPTRWLCTVEQRFSSDELRALGEMIASQELHEGVLIGLSSDAVMNRWKRLFRTHSDARAFAWSGTSGTQQAE